MQASELMRGHSLDGLWAKTPELIAGCGAFPVRVRERLVATVSVSGLHDGGDHELIIQGLERELGLNVLRYSMRLT